MYLTQIHEALQRILRCALDVFSPSTLAMIEMEPSYAWDPSHSWLRRWEIRVALRAMNRGVRIVQFPGF